MAATEDLIGDGWCYECGMSEACVWRNGCRAGLCIECYARIVTRWTRHEPRRVYPNRQTGNTHGCPMCWGFSYETDEELLDGIHCGRCFRWHASWPDIGAQYSAIMAGTARDRDLEYWDARREESVYKVRDRFEVAKPVRLYARSRNVDDRVEFFIGNPDRNVKPTDCLAGPPPTADEPWWYVCVAGHVRRIDPVDWADHAYCGTTLAWVNPVDGALLTWDWSCGTVH